MLLLLSLDNCNAPKNSEILFTQQLPFSQPGGQSASHRGHISILPRTLPAFNNGQLQSPTVSVSGSDFHSNPVSSSRSRNEPLYHSFLLRGPTAGDAVGISAIFVACATFIQAAKLSSGYQRTNSARSPLPDWCVMWTLIGSTTVARSSSRRGRRGRRGRLGFNHSLWTLLVQLPTCCRLRKTLWRLDQTDSNLNKVYSARPMGVQQEVKGV